MLPGNLGSWGEKTVVFGAKKKTGLILTLGLFLFLGTSPVGAAEETSGEFLERCLGKVENIEQTDTEAGVSACQSVWVGRCLHMASTVEEARR